VTFEELQRAFEEMRVRVAKLERRLDALEPETVTAVGQPAPSASPMLDVLADALDAFGR